MKNVLWIDKNILQRYRKQWSPVSHPLILTGRRPLEIEKTTDTTSESGARGSDKRGGDNVDESSGGKKSNNGSKQEENRKTDGKKRKNDESLRENIQDSKIEEISKIVVLNENENKNSISTVDEARKRFLARKKAK